MSLVSKRSSRLVCACPIVVGCEPSIKKTFLFFCLFEGDKFSKGEGAIFVVPVLVSGRVGLYTTNCLLCSFAFLNLSKRESVLFPTLNPFTPCFCC